MHTLITKSKSHNERKSYRYVCVNMPEIPDWEMVSMRRKDRQFGEVSEKTRKNMQKIRSKDTSIEVALRKRLWHKGYRYRKNYKKLPGSPDIAIMKHKIAIFCDSEFFHGKEWDQLKTRLERGKNPQYWIKHIEENMERDRRAEKELEALDWTVIRFWGNDIKKDLEGCLQVIEEAVFDKMINSCASEGIYDNP